MDISKVNKLFVELEAWGCNIDEAMDRLLDDKEIFLRFLFQFIEDEKFVELEQAIHENNREKAFECGHALKGVAGNLSLKPIYYTTSLLVEALRNEDTNKLIPLLEDVLEKKEELCAITKKAGFV